MAFVSDEILERVNMFVDMVSNSGLHLERVILFGSYVKGKAGKWSDIDIALVSKDFTGVGFYDRKSINPYLIKIDSRIEPHPFRPEDFTADNSFVKEILEQGIEIKKLNELKPLKEILRKLRKENKILIAILYGSYAYGIPHERSDIDLAVFIKARNKEEEIEIIDEILMSVEREVSILRLDDENESPFVIQEALKGIYLIEPEEDTLYEVAYRVLHSTEEIRFRRLLRAL